MSGNTIGKLFTVTTFGESHGPAMGCIVDGCPPGMPLSESDLQQDVDRRRSGTSHFVSQRRESDQVRILSGVFEGCTTGTPIGILIENTDARSRDYEKIKDRFRPGHADYTYQQKYGARDYRGGGRSSARETVMRTAAGAIARRYLAMRLGVRIYGYLSQVGPLALAPVDPAFAYQNPFFCPDPQRIQEIEELIWKVRGEGDSIGARVTVVASGVPPGLGEPVFDRLDADIAHALMSINAVKAVEIGAGVRSATQRGSEHRDELTPGGFRSNNAGGVLGGISSGQEIIAHLTLKPTSSIQVPGSTIDVAGNPVEIVTTGRHDPCVGLRATPIAEAMLAIVLMDHYLRHRAQNADVKSATPDISAPRAWRTVRSRKEGSSMDRQFAVAVVGATGLVGEMMINVLEERAFPVSQLFPLASNRSLGRSVSFRGQSYAVNELEGFDFAQCDFALFSAGAAVSREHAPRAAAAGCIVIDNTSEFRYQESVPLVVPEVNPQALEGFGDSGIVANPNCSTIQLVVALKPLHDEAHLERVEVATYQSVSGAGREAVEELARQSIAALSGQGPPQTHGGAKPIAFNCVPHIDAFQDNGYTREEMKIVWETRKILGEPQLRVNATAVRVPVFYGHSEAVHIDTTRPLSALRARELLENAPGVTVLDERRPGGYPTATTEAANRDTVYVGRIREDLAPDRGLNLWIVADNVRKGAATNSVQIAEALVRRPI